ncbi:MAG: hypothetical protein AMXMBFR33_67320 [Candidatus Xenobia bacterium]
MLLKTPTAGAPAPEQAPQPLEKRPLGENPEVRNRAVQTVTRAAEDQGLSRVASPENPGFDATSISAELLSEMDTKNVAKNGDIDSLVQALQGLVQPRVDQHLQQGQQAQPQDPAGGGGVNAVQESQQPKKQQKAYWNPSTEPGMLHGGRDVIGRVDIKEETVQPNQQAAQGQAGQNATKKPNVPRQVAPAGQAGGAKSSGGGTGAPGGGAVGSAPPAAAARPTQATQPAQQAKTTNPSKPGEDDKETDKVELSPETQQAAQQLQGQPGVQQPEQLQNAAKSGEGQAGATGSYDVQTRATGSTQSVDVQSAGQIGPGSYFRSFRKLDDSPLLASPTLHKRKGGEVANNLEEQQNAQKGQQPQQVDPTTQTADPQLLAKLRNPRADQT